VAVASANMSAPVAETRAGGSSVVTVNGPRTPAPSRDAGSMLTLGGSGSITGPAWRMSLTIATTAPRSGSVVFRTYRSVKNQIAACTAAAR
jgi:hypothetical protein